MRWRVKIIKLQTENMLPRIIDARQYELTEKDESKPKRTVRIYELSYYIEGGGTIYIDEDSYFIRNGDVRFARPGTVTNSIPSYKCYTILFDFGEDDVIYENQILDKIPDYFHTSGECVHFFEEIIKSNRSTDPAEKLRGNALLMQLIVTLYSSVNYKKACSAVIERSKKYMEENYTEEITLKALGELTGYSHIHIMRLFRQEVGVTPHKWLTEIRINRAKALLAEGNATLEEIAEGCGFSSPSHFKILFKDVTGFTPGAYRKKISLIY